MTARKMKQYKTRRRGENRAGQNSRGRREFSIREEEEEEEKESEPILIEERNPGKAQCMLTQCGENRRQGSYRRGKGVILEDSLLEGILVDH